MFTRKKIAAPLAFTALALFAASAGCKEDPILLGEITETSLGATGGTAISAAGELTLTVPSGVFSGSTKLVIRTDRAAAHETQVGARFFLSTEPAIAAFAKPIAVELKNTDHSVRELAIANLDGASPVRVDSSTYDDTTKIARAELSHFSSYGLIRLSPNNPCPQAEPTPGDACTLAVNTTCYYGQETCCGETHPSIFCSCDGTTWACGATDACFGSPITCPDAGVPDASGPDSGVEPQCPVDFEAAQQATCTIDNQICTYGEETCCNRTHPSISCRCDAAFGGYACHYTDACLGAPGQCPDAG